MKITENGSHYSFNGFAWISKHWKLGPANVVRWRWHRYDAWKEMITNRLQQENSNGSDLNRNPLRLLEQDLLRTACLKKRVGWMWNLGICNLKLYWMIQTYFHANQVISTRSFNSYNLFIFILFCRRFLVVLCPIVTLHELSPFHFIPKICFGPRGVATFVNSIAQGTLAPAVALHLCIAHSLCQPTLVTSGLERLGGRKAPPVASCFVSATLISFWDLRFWSSVS